MDQGTTKGACQDALHSLCWYLILSSLLSFSHGEVSSSFGLGFIIPVATSDHQHTIELGPIQRNVRKVADQHAGIEYDAEGP